MDSENDFRTTGLTGCFKIENADWRSNMKKFWTLLVMLTLFMAMGMTVQAKKQGESEQSAKTEMMLGEDLDLEQREVVLELLDELITTREAVKDVNSQVIEEVIAFIKAKLAAGDLETDEEIRDAIEEGEEKFKVSLTDEEKERILQVMQKIKDLGLDPEKLLDQTKDLYGKYGSELFENAEETVKQNFFDSITGFFDDMGTRVKGFFTDIFSRG